MPDGAHTESEFTRCLYFVHQSDRLEGSPPTLRQWILDGFIQHFRTYSMRVPQPVDLEIIPLLEYKDQRRQSSAQSSASARQPAQAPSEDEVIVSQSLFVFFICFS